MSASPLRRTVRLAGSTLLVVTVLGAGCSNTDPEPAAPAASTAPTEAPTSTSSSTTSTTLTPYPKPARDATTLAAQITASERILRDPSSRADDTRREAWLQQAAARVLAADSSLRQQTLALVPADFRQRVSAHADAQGELFALTTPAPAGKLPSWRIVTPPPPEELIAHYKAAGEEVGVPWPYLAAINLVETRMGRIRGTSSAGAQGPMQFLPSTWTQYGGGGDINDPRAAIFAAARLLRRNGAPDNMANALFNYNRSQRYVRAVTAYAQQLTADEGAYRSYWYWQVYYRTSGGDLLLPEGWPDIPATTV